MRLQQYLLSLIFVGLCTGTALAQTGAIPALFSRTLNLPVVGLASSETAQVNVVNLAAPVPAGTNGGVHRSGALPPPVAAASLSTTAAAALSAPLHPSPSARAKFSRPRCPIRTVRAPGPARAAALPFAPWLLLGRPIVRPLFARSPRTSKPSTQPLA